MDMWNAQAGGGSYPTQWALNPAAYANTPNEQVDWASLAQQWIKMKETMGEGAMEAMMTAAAVQPPPPAVPPTAVVAPAGVTAPVSLPPGDSAVGGGGPGWQEGVTSTSAGGWWDPPAVQPAPQTAAWDQASAVASAATAAGWYQEAPPPPPPPTPSYSFQPTPPPPPHFSNSSNQGYWSGGGKEWSGSSGRHNNSRRSSVHQQEPAAQQLDAMKRKQLPAWIRDGLEKMEKEKLKRAEQERYSRESEHQPPLSLEQPPFSLSQSDSHPLNGSDSSPPHTDSNHFVDSDSDREEIAVRRGLRGETPPPRFQVAAPPLVSSPPQPIIPKSKEEIFQSVMLGVRRILTQLLMEVTGEEIKKIADTVARKHRRKASATTVHKTMALTSLTGQLGLGIYESDSESDSNQESPDEDSEQEIRARIRRKQEEFERREVEIDREVEEQEEREKRVLQGYIQPQQSVQHAATSGSGTSPTAEGASRESSSPEPPSNQLNRVERRRRIGVRRNPRRKSRGTTESKSRLGGAAVPGTTEETKKRGRGNGGRGTPPHRAVPARLRRVPRTGGAPATVAVQAGAAARAAVDTRVTAAGAVADDTTVTENTPRAAAGTVIGDIPPPQIPLPAPTTTTTVVIRDPPNTTVVADEELTPNTSIYPLLTDIHHHRSPSTFYSNISSTPSSYSFLVIHYYLFLFIHFIQG